MPDKTRSCCGLSLRLLIVVAAIYAYFVVFPEDSETLVTPLALLSASIASVAGSLLEVTTKVSPWLYVLAAVCVVAWSVTRIWGKR